MNEWVIKSIELANSPGYLDRLQEVYPITQGAKREIGPGTQEELKQIYDGGDDLALIRRLLKLPKFPINDPYVAFLRKNIKKSDIYLRYNPHTVNRIAGRIKSMGFETMLNGISAPKVATKQIGNLFNNWIAKIGYPMLSEDDFETGNEGIAFLQGSGARLRHFANGKLGCGLDKEPDFLAKAQNVYVVGEAKFLTEYGGAQNSNFEDALRLLTGTEGSANRIAVLDGVVWLDRRAKMCKAVRQLDEVALSALLLKDFLESL